MIKRIIENCDLHTKSLTNEIYSKVRELKKSRNTFNGHVIVVKTIIIHRHTSRSSI